MKEAQRLGLVNWVVPADQLAARTLEIARRIANGPRIAYRYMPADELGRGMDHDVSAEFERLLKNRR